MGNRKKEKNGKGIFTYNEVTIFDGEFINEERR